MKSKVISAIEDFNMIESGQDILVGLSGGADSVALLLVLKELGYNVSACHINHQLRGEESDRDENFCIDLCKRLNIRLFVEKIDVITYCSQNKLGTEEGARELRYQTFSKYSNGGKVATAHTASDNIETVLINFTRGTALKGLCGIPPVRDSIVRPLIYCTRADVEEYLKEKGQDFVTDSTNLTSDYTRNKIRNEVVPILREINPSLEKSFIRTNHCLTADFCFLEDLSDCMLDQIRISENTYDARILKNMDTALSTRCIAEILKNNNLECCYDKVKEISAIIKAGGKINLSGDVYAESKSGKLKIYVYSQVDNKEVESPLTLDKEIPFFEKKILITKTNVNLFNKTTNVNKKFAISILDYDKIQGKAIVRNRRNGDRIRLAGRSHSSSVKKLFNTDISLEKRGNIVFLADEKGVIFIEGYGVAESVKVDKDTTNILVINILEGNVQIG